MKDRTWLLSCACAGVLMALACNAPENPVYGPDNPDPNPTGSPAATITALDPPEGFLKDVVKISGSGFNSEPAFNFVQFGDRTGTVLAASATELSVETPNLSDETVMVRVAVKGSELWSNQLSFSFKPTLATIDDAISWPKGVAVDDSDNVFVGSGNDGIIFKITPAGEKSEFAHVAVDGSIHFGPNNFLYVCNQSEGKIMRVSPDGATIEDYVVTDGLHVIDFDWDNAGDMYIVANDSGIVKYAGGNLSAAADLGTPKSCRVYENHFYVTDIWDTGSVWRFDITAAGLENGESIYTNADVPPLGVEVDIEGTVYISEAWDAHLLAIHADASTERLYEGEMSAQMRYLTFHKKTMYAVFPGSGDIGLVLSAYIGVEQAPNYGKR
ncbi:MAG: IPT/TIG domain-containing protein [bacterium]